MTALEQFQRLEASGLWRPGPEAQRRNVVVSLGDASLVLTDAGERPLAHWSLAAIERRNGQERPALYAPGLDAEDELEIDDEVMIEALEKVRRSVARRRPRSGRVRFRLMLAFCAVLTAVALFWLPGAVVRYTAAIAPEAKREAIGRDLLGRMQRVSGQPCANASGRPALRAFEARLGADQILVMRDGVATTAHLPDGTILLGRAVVEDHESPAVAAGFVLAERLRMAEQDPLLELLQFSGIWATLKLMTQADLPPRALDLYAEHLLRADPQPVPDPVLLAAFDAASLVAAPYAYALDITGETTIGLIEGGLPAASARPVLGDDLWVALQGICGE